MENKSLEDKVDLLYIFKLLIQKKKSFIIPSVVSAVLGVIIALSIPNYYKTEVLLAPEVGGSGSLTDNLSDLASMVGVNFSTSSSSYDALYPELYPQIVHSSPFVLGLFDVKVTTLDRKIHDMTYADYLKKHAVRPWWTEAIGAVEKLFAKNEEPKKDSLDRFCLTKEQEGLKQKIIGDIKCSVDKKTSVITIDVTAQDPCISAIIADTIQSRLQDYITEYRTKKAKVDVEYTEKILEKVESQYNSIINTSASYSDSHFNPVLESVKSHKEKLNKDVQIKSTEYTQLKQQLALAKAKLQERTPVFTQIEPASVPVLKAGPKRALIVLGFIIVAVIFTSILIIAKDARNK